MSRQVHVAVIGAGTGAAHVEAYCANGALYRGAVVCDLDAAHAAKAAGRAGAAVETSYDAVLRRVDIDLIDICLPPSLHASAIEQALRAVGMCCAKSRWSARYARSSASSSWQRVPATRWSLSTNTVTEYGDICRMRLEDRSFDTAVSTLVLDVVPDAARRGDFCGAWVRLAVC
jgi:Oxidoreductase family, NAD-binding Rossmann fold